MKGDNCNTCGAPLLMGDYCPRCGREDEPCSKCGGDQQYCYVCGNRERECECEPTDRNMGECDECESTE